MLSIFEITDANMTSCYKTAQDGIIDQFLNQPVQTLDLLLSFKSRESHGLFTFNESV